MQLPPGSTKPALLQGIPFWMRPLASLERSRARYGTPFTMRLPLTPQFVIFDDPDHIKQIFTAPPDVLHPGTGARVLEPLVGSNSVILLDERPHMSQRKLMLPAFHGEKMARLEGLVEEVTERDVAAWRREEPVRLHPLLQRLTMEIILRAVFGLDPGPRMDELRKRLEALLAFGDRPVSLLPIPEGSLADRIGRRIGPFREFLGLQEAADRLIFELIDERRASAEDRHDVLAMLLEARHEDGAPMSDQELRDELMTLLVAGHETTATSLAWALNRLPSHPEVVGRIREEHAGGGEDAYVTATIQESLRRRPVLPNTAPRYVMKPIEVGGRTYEPGVSLVGNGYLLHHNPAVYPDAYEFRPERFLDEPPGTYTWIPFGGGRRRCLGASFAMLEMRIVLRQVLAAYDVTSVNGVEMPRRRNITITPSGGALSVLRVRAGGAQRPAGGTLAEPEPVGEPLAAA